MKIQNTQKLMVLALIATAAASTGCSMVAGKSGGTSAASVSGDTSGGGGTTTTTGGGTVTAVSNSVGTTVPMFDQIPGRIMAALTLPATTASPTPTSLV